MNTISLLARFGVFIVDISKVDESKPKKSARVNSIKRWLAWKASDLVIELKSLFEGGN